MGGKPEVWTNLTGGAAPATTAKSARNPHVTSLATSLAMMISTTMANGETCPNTDTCGIPPASPQGGRRTATDIGRGSLRGDGRGSRTNPGALLHFTTGAGQKSE